MTTDESNGSNCDEHDADEESAAILDELANLEQPRDSSEEKARPHHYDFAHRDLPKRTFEDASAFAALMASGR